MNALHTSRPLAVTVFELHSIFWVLNKWQCHCTSCCIFILDPLRLDQQVVPKRLWLQSSERRVVWEIVPTASFVLWRWRHFYWCTKVHGMTFWATGILKVTQITKILAMTDSVMPIAYNVFYVYLPAMFLIFQKIYLCMFQCAISDCKHTHHHSKIYRFSFSSEKEERPVVSCLIVSASRRGLKACL